jgi:uncharacterized protein
MKIFLDTSSIFKLYHQEEGTLSLEAIFAKEKITQIYLSEITKLEFTSTVWKKVRTKEITNEQAKITIELFESDFAKYNFITTDSLIIEQARILISKYSVNGLRTLDGIQLSTCVSLKENANLFLTADLLFIGVVNHFGPVAVI